MDLGDAVIVLAGLWRHHISARASRIVNLFINKLDAYIVSQARLREGGTGDLECVA